ncbi:MAG TPA: GDSL-type esterase/lipase family protein [Candidatus Hydrogenedentes bacterium]|nr:GDSL-type esterase/lipase family protein [Candidatus Hydrogenedentota bacterium]
MRHWLVNVGLLCAGIAAAVGMSVAADRAAALFVDANPLPSSMELVFPPGSEMAYDTGEFKYTVRINRYGYRDVEPLAIPRGAYRIMALGDSFTYGFGVEAEQTWPKQLETMLRARGCHAAVMNLGKPGADPAFYADAAERAIPVLKPNLIVVALLQTDDMTGDPPRSAPAPSWIVRAANRLWPHLLQLVQERRGVLKPATASQPVRPPLNANVEKNRSDQVGAARQVLEKMKPDQRARYDALAPEVRQAFESGNLNPFVINVATEYPDLLRNAALPGEAHANATAIGAVAAHLVRIREAALHNGAEVLVVSVPLGAYVNETALEGYRRLGYTCDSAMLASDAPDEAIRAACNRAEIPFATVTSAFREHRTESDLYYALDGHFTPKGHRLFAELITPAVLQAMRR